MLILAATLAILVYGLIAPILGALLPTYGLTSAQQGELAMAQAIGLVVATLTAGPVIDKRGNKAALVVGLLLVAVSLFSAPNAGAFTGLVAVYFVLGLGGGIVVMAANALVGSVEPTRRTSALNSLNLFFGLGGILTTYAASHLFNAVTLCYSVGALTLIALLVNVVAAMPGPAGAGSFRLDEVPSLLSSPALLLLALFLFLYVACEVGIWNWLNSFLQKSRGFSAGSAGSVVSYGFAFGILVGRLVVSRLLVRVPPLTVTLFSAALIAITTYLMLRLPSQSSITVAVFCAGLSMAPVFPTVLAVVGDIFRRGTATAMSVVMACGWIGLAVSSTIIGAVANHSDLSDGLLLLPAFAVVMVLVNLALRAVLKRPLSV